MCAKLRWQTNDTHLGVAPTEVVRVKGVSTWNLEQPEHLPKFTNRLPRTNVCPRPTARTHIGQELAPKDVHGTQRVHPTPAVASPLHDAAAVEPILPRGKVHAQNPIGHPNDWVRWVHVRIRIVEDLQRERLAADTLHMAKQLSGCITSEGTRSRNM